MTVSLNPGVSAAWLPAWLTPARLAMTLFFLQATLLNSWFPRIPDVQAKLGIGPAELSIALLAMSLGGFFTTFLVAKIIERLTARGSIVAGFIVCCILMLLPGWAWSVATLSAVLFLVGSTYFTMDLATNVEIARIQESLGRPIMSTCHGFWSLGSMLGLALGSGFAQAGVDVRWQMLIVGGIVMVLGVIAARALPVFDRTVPVKTERAPIVSLPSAGMIGLCVFAFGVMLAELTTRNWGAVYLREVVGASPAAAGVGFFAFSLFMAVGRFLGDRLTNRFGPVALGRFCAAMAVVGVVLLLVANNLPIAVAAFAALGVGVSVGFPLAVTAAASRGDRAPARNVAALALIAYTGSIIGPPLVGFVAQSAGLRAGLAAILPLMILSALFAGSLRSKAK